MQPSPVGAYGLGMGAASGAHLHNTRAHSHRLGGRRGSGLYDDWPPRAKPSSVPFPIRSQSHVEGAAAAFEVSDELARDAVKSGLLAIAEELTVQAGYAAAKFGAGSAQ
jgi:hypothetical protein